MKQLYLKLLITAIVILIGFIVIRLLFVDNKAEENGSIYLYIQDENGVTVFEGEVAFETGDTFFDLLNREFDLTCATASYTEDPSCGYDFQSFAYQGKVILGIKGEDFDLMTNWNDTFLSFYHYNHQEKELATRGPSNIPYKDGDTFLISYELAWGS